MDRKRRRALRPVLQPLDSRLLLSGLDARWIGQDGHDAVGREIGEQPNGVQDVHIGVTGLRAGGEIRSIELLGHGGGRWIHGDLQNSWGAAFAQPGGETSGNLYIEPDRVETGREFQLIVTYWDGVRDEAYFQGGTADPGLRATGSQLSASWVGQVGTDDVGPGVGVGPDGFQDARLQLTGLATTAVESIVILGPPGASWQAGPGAMARDHAELFRDSGATEAVVAFAVDRDLDGEELHVEVTYVDGSTDESVLIAESTDPRLASPPPTAPPARVSGVVASWRGQAADPGAGPGWVALDVVGLPAGKSIRGAILSGQDHTSWVYRSDGVRPDEFYSDPYAAPLHLTTGAGTRATFAFAPDGPLADETLSLRITYDDGSLSVSDLRGGAIDLSKLSPLPSGGTIAVTSGVDLQDLSSRYGRIELAPGVYDLDAPLILSKPITIRAPSGNVTLRFHQPADADAWTAAIKLAVGNTTLEGFNVRFSGPIRWRDGIDYGPAVIGTLDNFDVASSDSMENIQIRNLDIQAPLPSRPGDEAPRTLRLTRAGSGSVVDNRIQGGPIEVLGGPWSIVGNRFLGAMQDSWAFDAIATHYVHDLVVRANVVDPLPDAGQIYRFLVVTGTADGAVVDGNSIRGVGIEGSQSDPLNAPEVILTEAYRLHFEGLPNGLSADGRLLQIPAPQGTAAGTGDVVAILDGPFAGRYVRIAQAIDPQTYLLAEPLPTGTANLSISSGLLGLKIRDNSIDLGRDSRSTAVVLVGAQFGTEVVGNTFTGGVAAVRAAAYPTEAPGTWGWSHTPWLGGRIESNTIQDSRGGLIVSVSHGGEVLNNSGRLYLSTTIRGNTIAWSDAFSTLVNLPGGRPAITVGEPGSIDPGELSADLSDNHIDVPPGVGDRPYLSVISARVQGVDFVDRRISLRDVSPPAPPTLALLHDTGIDPGDRLTNDGHLAISDPVETLTYEYRIGPLGAYKPVTVPGGFLPPGLTDGYQRVFVRAIDARGRIGSPAVLSFVLDTARPGDAPPRLLPASDTGSSSTDGVTRGIQPLGFRVDRQPGEMIRLIRDGVVVAEGTGIDLVERSAPSEGNHQYSLVRVDRAGNWSRSSPISIRVDRTPPSQVDGVEVSPTGVLTFQRTSPQDRYVYRVNLGEVVHIGTQNRVLITPAPRPGDRVDVVTIDLAGNISATASYRVPAVQPPQTAAESATAVLPSAIAPIFAPPPADVPSAPTTGNQADEFRGPIAVVVSPRTFLNRRNEARKARLELLGQRRIQRRAMLQWLRSWRRRTIH